MPLGLITSSEFSGFTSSSVLELISLWFLHNLIWRLFQLTSSSAFCHGLFSFPDVNVHRWVWWEVNQENNWTSSKFSFYSGSIWAPFSSDAIISYPQRRDFPFRLWNSILIMLFSQNKWHTWEPVLILFTWFCSS